MSNYDSIIIGAGLNGLTAAAYLAKAGQKVLVVERREIAGGSAVTEEVFPGFKFETVRHSPGWINPHIVRDLGLEKHGLALSDPLALVFAPLPDGSHLLLRDDVQQTADSIRRFSPADAEKWPDFCRLVARLSGFLADLYTTVMPATVELRPGELWPLAQLGLNLRRMGPDDMLAFVRALPMSVAEWLNDWFELDALKGVLAASGIAYLMQGPMATGTALNFLHHNLGNPPGAIRAMPRVRGGVGGLGAALMRAAQQFGVHIRMASEVAEIIVEAGRAAGVRLLSGSEFRATRILSSADPTTTFLRLMDPIHLDVEFIRQVQCIKYRGAFAKINLGLSDLPHFTALKGDRGDLSGVISISPSIEYLEHAYDDAKYGGISKHPCLEAVIPTLLDPTLAPSGKHVMSVHVQYVPYHLTARGGWSDKAREKLADAVTDLLAEYAPNMKNIVIRRQVLAPPDLERQYLLPEGNCNHGELMLDQMLFMRPLPGYADYSTPLDGLYLCGSSTHPGGGVAGGCGYNAARRLLRDSR